MLAASIAFSPLAILSANPNISSAASVSITKNHSVTELVNHFYDVYDQLDSSVKKDLFAIQKRVKEIDDSQWKTIIDEIHIEGADSDKKVAVAKKIAKVFYSATPEELEKNATEFANAINDADVQVVFGPDVTAESLLNYLAQVELELVDTFLNMSNDELNSMSDLNYYIEVYSAFKSAGEQYVNEYTAFKNVLDLPTLLTLKDGIQELVDPNHEYDIRGMFIRVLTGLHPQENENDGNSGSSDDPSDGSSSGGGFTSPSDNDGTTTPIPGKPTEQHGGVATSLADVVENPTKVIETIKNAKDFNQLEVVIGSVDGNVELISLFKEVLEAIIAKNPHATIDIVADEATYKLPVSEIKLDDLAKQLDVPAEDVQISITVKVTEDTANVVEGNNLTTVAPIIEFKVEATNKSGKTVEVDRFTQYVSRDIVVNNSVDPDNSTGVRLNNDGTFSYIPTYFDEGVATIHSLTNSKYTVVENEKTFTDVNDGKNWAEEHIEKLASKYVINGKSDASFAPNDYMTRGEFAALISRSLGLTASKPYDGYFPDVTDKMAVNENNEIMAAVEAGIIYGKEDGHFYPYENITCAEAAIMIARAIEFTNADVTLNENKHLNYFKDVKEIGASARSSVETVLQAGIIEGDGSGQFNPQSPTKRDQMAKILDKFLQSIKFIN